MSWWNPITWGGDVADDVIDRLGDAASAVKKKIIEKPSIIVGPIVVIAGAIATVEAARSFGKGAGKDGANALRIGKPEEDE